MRVHAEVAELQCVLILQRFQVVVVQQCHQFVCSLGHIAESQFHIGAGSQCDDGLAGVC